MHQIILADYEFVDGILYHSISGHVLLEASFGYDQHLGALSESGTLSVKRTRTVI